MSGDDDTKAKARSAAQFIRDLHYNTTLRVGYAALFKTHTTVAKFNKFLSDNGYTCKDTDFAAGWKSLCNQSLIAWQAIYELQSDTSNDKTRHTCMVVGSRTGKCRILFDNKEIIGFTDSFKDKQLISWKAGSSSSDLNCELVFKLKAVTGEPFDVRHIDATIWKKDQTKPTEHTHSGHDVYSDINMFDGTYTTVVTDPDTSDSDSDEIVEDGPTIQVVVDSGTTPEKVTLKVHGSDKSFHVAANKVPCNGNTITWAKKDNDNDGDGTNKTLSDVDDLPWINGWLNFSWTYVPPTNGATYSMVQHAKGASWKEKKENSQEISGYCKVDPSAKLISPLPAEIAGYTLTIGIFGLIGYKVIKSLVTFLKWTKKKLANDELRNQGKTVAEQDEIEEDGLRQGLDDAIEILPADISNVDIVDAQDTRTHRRQLDSNGDPVYSHSGGDVYVNELDPSGQTALANFTKEGDATVYKEAVQKDGTLLKDVADYPTISSPIKNIKTQADMTVREIGKTFTHTVSVDVNTKIEEALRGDGEPLKELSEEPLHDV